MNADEIRSLIAVRNLRNHGWDRFEHGTRLSALRMIRASADEAVLPRYEVRTIEADPSNGATDGYWKAPPQPVHYVHDTLRDRPLFGSHHDKTAADSRCATLNAAAIEES